MKSRLPLAFVALLLFLASFIPCQAQEKPLEQDTDKNGKVDRIIRFGEGRKIAVMETDTNGDGLMDRFQYYRNEQVVRLEADSDHDGKVDLRDLFEEGKRTRHEKISEASGRVAEITRPMNCPLPPKRPWDASWHRA